MPERILTPLDGIAGFDETIRKKLADPYWITTAEEFRSTINFSGRKTLSAVLGVDDATLGRLADAVNAALPQDTPFDIAVEFEVGAGLDMTGVPEPEASFAAAVDLPAAVEPLTKAKGIPDPQNQGQRNTCVAFSLASIMQILSGDTTDLSEQFLYYLCKERDGVPGDTGTNPDLAMRLLQEVGICTEATWAYVATRNDAQPGGPTPPASAYAEAKLRQITSFTQLQSKGSTAVTQIQAQLAEGRPVMIGMPIYAHWTGATQATILGRLRFPLPGEQPKGGHAMCVVGYRTDETAPGGGYFIVRNSWGTDWGKDNSDGPGYCHIPFLLVNRQNLVTFAADGVVETAVQRPVTAVAAVAAVATKPAPGKQSARAKRGIRGSARLSGSAEGGDSLMAIYADLRDLGSQVDDLKGQIDGIGARLQRILGVSPSAAEDEPDVVAAAEPAVTLTKAAAPPAPEPEPTPVPYTAPLVFISTGAGEESEDISPNGIDGVTGQRLLTIDAATAARLAKGQGVEPPEMQDLYKAKEEDERAKEAAKQAAQEAGEEPTGFLTIGDVDPNKIDEARWAIVISAAESVDLLKSLWPLIRQRMVQMGGFRTLDFDFQSGDTSCGVWLNRHSDGGKKNLKDNWGEVPPVLLVNPGENVNAWLRRHGTSQAPVDPSLGIPFYLMIVGRPGPLDASDQAYIPLHFQYELDFFWAVGRLIFSDVSGRHRLDDYRTYAERVVAWENQHGSNLNKQIGFFGTRHDDDNSTMRSADELVSPLIEWSKKNKYSIEKKPKSGFGRTIYLAQDATRSNLEQLLKSRPALLFTASHGVGLPMSDPSRLVLNQGALVTADFEYGSIKREHWLSGEDLDEMNPDLNGMISFLFACYGAGCPQKDEFIFDANKRRQQIAPFPFVAQLPQRMLAHGALAVLGHVERAWTYSFSSTEGATAQIQPFQDVLSRLLNAWAIGSATDQFNVIQGARSLTLTQALEQGMEDGGAALTPSQLSRLWMARNDARNYMLLGDPAVKLGT